MHCNLKAATRKGNLGHTTLVPEDSAERAWHQALAYAIWGRRLEQLGRQRSPDIAALSTALRDFAEEGVLILPSSRDQAVHSVPKDLMQDLGAAQFHASVLRNA